MTLRARSEIGPFQSAPNLRGGAPVHSKPVGARFEKVALAPSAGTYEREKGRHSGRKEQRRFDRLDVRRERRNRSEVSRRLAEEHLREFWRSLRINRLSN